MTGIPSHTLSRGKIVWANGVLDAVRGAGQYVKRPAFNPMFDALKRQSEVNKPTAVKRE